MAYERALALLRLKGECIGDVPAKYRTKYCNR